MDADRLEREAQELHENRKDREWCRTYSQSPDFTGWPEDLEHGKCPFCRHYPLKVVSLKQPKPLRKIVSEKPLEPTAFEVESTMLEFEHDGPISAIAVSKDLNLIATGSYDAKTVKLWDAKTGEYILTIDVRATAIAITEDNRFILTSLGNLAKKWSAKTGELIVDRIIFFCNAHLYHSAYIDSDSITVIPEYDNVDEYNIHLLDGRVFISKANIDDQDLVF